MVKTVLVRRAASTAFKTHRLKTVDSHKQLSEDRIPHQGSEQFHTAITIHLLHQDLLLKHLKHSCRDKKY